VQKESREMRFDLNLGIGEWFPYFGSQVKADGEVEYFDPEPEGGKVLIRIADSGTVEKIQAETRKKISENVFNTVTRHMERVVSYDQTPAQERKEREMIWDHAIMEWEGILDSKGDPIPCNLQNKMKLMNVPQFARFVARCLQLLSGAAAEAKEESEKN